MQHADLCSLLLHALRYEHWLRFHFMDDPESLKTEEGMEAVLRVPEEWVELEQKDDPGLFPILAELQGHVLSMERSRDAVFRHVAESLGKNAADPDFGAKMFELVSDPDFRRGLDLFHGWVQELADGEEQVRAGHPSGIPLFSEWETAFRAWAARQRIGRVTTITPYADKPQEERQA